MQGTLADLAPVGTLETAFAEQVALWFWRKRRITRHETPATAAGLEAVSAPVSVEAALLFHQPLPLPPEGGPSGHALAALLASLPERHRVQDGWAKALALLEALPTLPDGKALREAGHALPVGTPRPAADGCMRARLAALAAAAGREAEALRTRTLELRGRKLRQYQGREPADRRAKGREGPTGPVRPARARKKGPSCSFSPSRSSHLL